MDAVSLVVSILALLGAGAGFAVQRRDRKIDRKDADEAARASAERANRAQQTADDAAEAANRPAAASESLAAATERMAKALEREARTAAREGPIPQAAWTLAHNQGDTYLLNNVGTAVAYDVHVDTGDMVVRVPSGTWPRAEMSPDDAMKVLAVRTMGTKDDTVTVTRASEPGGSERHTWTRPLPPKPRG